MPYADAYALALKFGRMPTDAVTHGAAVVREGVDHARDNWRNRQQEDKGWSAAGFASHVLADELDKHDDPRHTLAREAGEMYSGGFQSHTGDHAAGNILGRGSRLVGFTHHENRIPLGDGTLMHLGVYRNNGKHAVHFEWHVPLKDGRIQHFGKVFLEHEARAFAESVHPDLAATLHQALEGVRATPEGEYFEIAPHTTAAG